MLVGNHTGKIFLFLFSSREEHKSHSPKCEFLLMNKKEEDWTVEDFLELETKRQLNRMVNIGLFIKLTLHHMSVEFLVGSHPCCESFVSKYARFSLFLKVTKFYRRLYGVGTIQTSLKSHYFADAYPC